MTEQTPLSDLGGALPAGAIDRLALFAKWTGTEPPKQILSPDGAFSDDLLAFAKTFGLSLAWFTLGDEKALVLQARYAAAGGRL